jgi:2,4-dienoyl-CoA reductase-like NADH-dependent reductase (Old Yellow Enzyme family)
MSDSNPSQIFSYLAEQLNQLRIVYLHVVDPVSDGAKRVSPLLRRKFHRSYIVNGGFDLDSANAAIRDGEADLVAFGVPFLANPDLPKRYRLKAPLNVPDQATFYAGEDKGLPTIGLWRERNGQLLQEREGTFHGNSESRIAAEECIVRSAHPPHDGGR